jgi:DnaK suppressor protein
MNSRPDALLRLYKSLLARRAALRDALAGSVDNLRTMNQTGDSADGAFDSGNEEISTQLAEMEARELSQIERALARLKAGKYGICEVCQKKIPVARLNALPYSTTCIDCQRKMEVCPGSADRYESEDWRKIRDAEAALEGQRDVDLTNLKRDLSRDF